MNTVLDFLDDDGFEDQFSPVKWQELANARRPKLTQTTEWFSGDVAPVHIGWYERYFVESPDNLSETRMHYWDGAHWRRTPIAQIHHYQVGDYPAWRGLADPSGPVGIFWDRSGSWLSVSGMNASSSGNSDLFPRPGDLWHCSGRVAVICGNGFHEYKDTRIWVMDWATGERASAGPEHLFRRADRNSLSEADILARFGEWGRAGNADALWWLAWWFEGVNHKRSTCYYVAALRADPKGYGWAQSRIMSDARTAVMCEGVPVPDISFVATIPELSGKKIGDAWMEAVINAEIAVDVPRAQSTALPGPQVVKLN